MKSDDLGKNGLAALRRAAKRAVEIARQTGTAAYVLQDGKIVDIARRPETSVKKRRHSRPT